LDIVLHPNQLDDFVVGNRLAAHLGSLEGQFGNIPLLEKLGKNDSWLTDEDIQPCPVGFLLKTAIKVLETLQEKAPDVHLRSTSVIVCVEPWVYDEHSLEALAAGDGISEGWIVVQAEGVETKPVDGSWRGGRHLWERGLFVHGVLLLCGQSHLVL